MPLSRSAAGMNSRITRRCGCDGRSAPHVEGIVSRVSSRRDEQVEIDLIGHPHEVGKGTRIHLTHHPAAVDFYRDLADAEIAGDLLVETALDDLRHDLAFALGQG